MTNEPSIDDKLKQAQIDKIQAEIKAVSKTSWMELIKLFGGVVLGIGGLAGAYTQYEVAGLKAENAKHQLTEIENKAKQELADFENKKAKAQEEIAKLDADLKEKEKLIKETQDKTIPELKKSLNQATIELQASNPELVKKRLVYVQFQGNTKREFIDELRRYLESASFSAPGAERRAGTYTSEVRYFPTSDKEQTSKDKTDAERLAKAVESFYETKGCRLNLPVKASSVSLEAGKQAPPEVWLADEDYCKQ